MVPASVAAAAVLVVAVLPGCVYTWAYERQAGAFGLTRADRTLRFVALSLILHLVLAWPEYAIYRLAFRSHRLDAGQVALIWLGLLALFAVPAGIGSVVGGLQRTAPTRNGWRWLRRFLPLSVERQLLRLALGHDPIPRAWDAAFHGRPQCHVRVRISDGSWLGGRFADESSAGKFPYDPDLLLEEAWEIDSETRDFVRALGHPVYIAAGEISYVEIIHDVRK